MVAAVAVIACGRAPLDQAPGDASGGAGQGGASAVSGAGGAAGAALRVPAMHRSSADPCPAVAAPTNPSPCATVGTGSCKTDRDCAAGTNGLCLLSLPFGQCSCTYDACFADGDCGPNVCACSGSYSGNACVTGNCHVDADCGVGGYCSPVVAPCTGAVTGYQCHGQKDACVLDADCGAADLCTFVATAGWRCSPAASCPL